ncbi:MAG: ABC transporter permease [Clostridia bacterium]|nr:ABC transporter permease [Clostridia bacterium]
MKEKIILHIAVPFKNAVRQVKSHVAQFLPFIFALLLMQALIFTVLFFYDNNYQNEKDLIESEYDYHVMVSGLDEYQMLKIREKLFPVTINSAIAESATNIDEITGEKYDRITCHDPDTEVTGNESYDVYYRLLTGNKEYGLLDFTPDTLESNYESFLYKVLPVLYEGLEEGEEPRAEITLSPLYRLGERKTENTLLCALTMLLLLFVSLLILISLFKTRASHFQFTYGIYATCGATARKLQQLAFFELLVCLAVSFLPALLLALGVTHAVYASAAIPFALTPSLILIEIPIALLTVALAVVPAMKLLSMKDPTQLLQGEDHSNVISSPSRSSILLGRRFPVDYERLSAWRMRRHHLKIAVTSGLLCTVFILGLYLCAVYREEMRLAASTDYDFTFTFEKQTYIDERTADKFRETDGIARVHKSHSERKALSLFSHVLLDRADVRSFSGLTEYPKGDRYYVTNDAAYLCAMDEDLIKELSESYRFDGDPYAILTEKDAVIIGASYQNRSVLDYQVGDSVYVAVLAEKEPEMGYELTFDENGHPVWILVEKESETKEEETTYQDVVQSMLTGEKQLLRQIETMDFVYRKLTVAAVIYDYPSAANGIPFVMNAASYKAVTGEEPTANTLYISADEDLSGNELSVLEGRMRFYTHLFDDTSCISHGAHFENIITDMSQYEYLMLLFASFAVLFVPIIWFYAQLLFYFKRKREFDLLQSIGADMTVIRRLHFVGVLLMIPLGILSLLTAALATFTVYVLSTFVLPVIFASGSAVVSNFSPNPLAYVIAFLLTFASSLLSSYIPFLRYRAQNRSENTVFTRD